ncbi:ribonuclease HII [Halocella sp. SP3-1]|uniref:ribonuclease HII n=1 Tax=Halocella sp. SP3-1 TaxID=2382161 RepID=UPI000F7570CB|nr:ribonuclease HII [Halocella sp. SP3-1]AZO95587.1 ribonuclease HII [Halocella sp. SP3-1]
MQWHKHTISEIKSILEKIALTDNIIEELALDPRKGVQKLFVRYRKMQQRLKEKKEQWKLLNEKEESLRESGYNFIAGVDEAGRGPLAGPVAAAAVILDPESKIIGLNDSKKLSAKEREELFVEIKEKALAVSIGIIENNVIDKLNILQATFKAMRTAIDKLDIKPDYLLIDGNRQLPDIKIKQETVIDGDSRVNAIAAASIIAKVSRDRIMDEYHLIYPAYGFIRNKGYGTEEHIAALKENGPLEIHRFSFSIVNEYAFKQFQQTMEEAVDIAELRELGDRIKQEGLFNLEQLAYLRKLYREKYERLNTAT